MKKKYFTVVFSSLMMVGLLASCASASSKENHSIQVVYQLVEDIQSVKTQATGTILNLQRDLNVCQAELEQTKKKVPVEKKKPDVDSPAPGSPLSKK